MESDEDEQDAQAVVSLQTTPGQSVYSKYVEILPGTLPTVDKHIKVGVIVSLDDGSSDQETSPPMQSNALALPDNVIISDLPENITLETEWYETENRKTMRMRLRPEPNTFFAPETIKFNLICNYEPDEDGEDQTQSASSEERGTDYFSDMDIEESGQNDKGVQTNIALGELLFSDSIASESNPEVESVAVQTYITAINDAEVGEEGEEEEPDTEDEESIDKYEAEQGGNIEKTSAERPEEDEKKNIEEDEEEGTYCACEEQKDEEEGLYCTCEEEVEEEEEEEENEEHELKEEEVEDAEAVDGVEKPSTEEPQKAHEEERAVHSTLTESPSGIPLCLLKGDPPWVDPLVDTYTVMWDTNLEVAPEDVDFQFRDTVDPISSEEKISQLDPLENMRRSQILSASFAVKVVSSDQSYFGSLMATPSSIHSLKRDPELFNVHIDLNTWGFPAALYERYCKTTTASAATLFDDQQPSTGLIIYMNEDLASLHSIYNPDTMEDVDVPRDADSTRTDPPDVMSVGFFTENGKPDSDTEHRDPPTKAVDALKELQTGGVGTETSIITEDMRTSGESNLEGEIVEGPRSISDEYLSTAEELQSSANSSNEDLNKEVVKEVRISPNLPLSLVIAINDSRPLILLLDPQDLPISIAIGTKNVPVNNASAACAIKKLDKNMFHINNIDLKETAITNLQLEKTKSGKVKCNITVDGKVKGQTIADLGTLGSTLLLNLPLECQEETLTLSTEKGKEHLTSEDTTLSENDLTEEVSIETEEGTFKLNWQEGLPVSEDVSPQRNDTWVSVKRYESQIHPNNRNEALRKFGDTKLPRSPERIKRKAGCRCKASNLNKLPHTTHQCPYNKLPKNFNCGVLAKTLLALEQQISPLNEALDDIKSKIKALEVEDPGILLSPVCSEGSSLLSRSDSGYEQEMTERMPLVQKEAITAKFPCMRNSSTHIQCMHDPSTELFTSCCRKSSLRTESCPMSGYMIDQSTIFNIPLDMDITYIVPTPVEVVAATTWPDTSLSIIPSDLGCLGSSISSPTEPLLPRISKWTNRR